VSHHVQIYCCDPDSGLLFNVLFTCIFNYKFKQLAVILFTARPSSAIRADKEHVSLSNISEFTQDIWALRPTV